MTRDAHDGAGIQVLVGRAPDGALRLDELETTDEISEVVSEELAARGNLCIDLVPARGARRTGADAGLTVSATFEAVLSTVAHAQRGNVTCYVGSESTRIKLLAMMAPRSTSVRTYRHGRWVIVVRQGDITSVVADAVVNASNTQLVLGSGVSGALRRACGTGLQREMSQIGGLTPNGMAVTGAHDLQTTSRILHVPTAGGSASVVRKALDNVLGYCAQHHLRSVAVPALGTGTGGLEVAAFARLCVEALEAAPAPDATCTVLLVLWDAAAFTTVSGVFEATAGFEGT